MVALLEMLALTNLVDYRVAFSTRLYAPHRNPHYLLDSELVHIHEPDQHLTGIVHGGTMTALFDVPSPHPHAYDIKYDHNGFRNDRNLTAAAIAIIGDSFVEGALVPSDQLISTVLARIRKSTVVNLGQTGYGPQQELGVLKRYALPLRPKVVVWMFSEGNDLKNVEQYEAIMANWETYSSSLRSLPDRSFSWNLLQKILPLLGNPKPLGDAVLC